MVSDEDGVSDQEVVRKLRFNGIAGCSIRRPTTTMERLTNANKGNNVT